MTTFGIGGPVDLVLTARCRPDAVASALRDVAGPLFVFGGGSNILASDDGLRGTLLVLADDHAPVRTSDGLIEVSASHSWDEFVSWCTDAGLSGFERLTGIPGTVGGAVVQNAGAFGQDIKRRLRSTKCIDVAEMREVSLDADECNFGYRDSIFKSRHELVVLSATFEMDRSAFCDLPEWITESPGGLDHVPLADANAFIHAKRKEKDHLVTETSRSAGSFFKNITVSRDDPTAMSVEAIFAERKDRLVSAGHDWVVERTAYSQSTGQLVAGSLISLACDPDDPERFRPGSVLGRVRLGRGGPNTILNDGAATAAEVLAIANEMQERVHNVFSAVLETEVVVLGDAPG